MNTYNKLLLDEIQVMANVLAKYLDSANLSIGDRLNISANLENAIDNLDCAYDIVKETKYQNQLEKNIKEKEYIGNRRFICTICSKALIYLCF